MTDLTTRIRNAFLAVRLARGTCPHWDYELDDDRHECCQEVIRCERALRALRAKQEEDQHAAPT